MTKYKPDSTYEPISDTDLNEYPWDTYDLREQCRRANKSISILQQYVDGAVSREQALAAIKDYHGDD